MLDEYTAAVQQGRLPPLDLHIIRESIDQRLAGQGVPTLSQLEASIPHTIPSTNPSDLPPDLTGETPPGFLTADQERDHLARLDARLGDPYNFTTNTITTAPTHSPADPLPIPYTDLTPREFERQAEMVNPQSQHNWLRTHAKPGSSAAHALVTLDGDEDSIAGEPATKPPPKKRQKKDKDLAKQVGDRAVEHARAREGLSPSAASGVLGDEEDVAAGSLRASGSGEADAGPPPPLLGKKKGKDPDGTYRVKGGKSGGGVKGKRKRVSGEDGGKEGNLGASAKKAKTAAAGVEGAAGGE